MSLRTRIDRHFALGVWLVLLALLVRQVLVYGTDIPFNDDWILIARLRPDTQHDFSELWRLHNEHRVPLAKLAWFVTVGGTHDARAGTFLTVILLAGSAWLCMRAAEKLRGRPDVTDAFFPLVLMHGGQNENLLNSFQLAFSVLAAVIVLGLVLIVTSDERPGPRRVAGIGCVALALPLTGGCGLPHAVAWIAWLLLVFKAARRSQEPDERKTGRIALAFALAIALLIVWYFVDYHLLPNFKPSGPGHIVVTAVQFLSRGIGAPVVPLWPWGSWAVLALFAWSLAVAWRAARESHAQQSRALGLTLVCVAMVGTALLVGYGRAVDGPQAGLLERYGLVSAPLWCAFAFAGVLGSDRAAGRALSITLFALAAACFVPNFKDGEREGAARRAKADALEADLFDGMTIDEVAANRWRDFFYSPELFASGLRDLEAAGMRPFDRLHFPRPAPPFQALLTEPLRTLASGDVQARQANGHDALLVRDGAELQFALGQAPAKVRGAFGIHPQLVALGLASSVRFTIELQRADGTSTGLLDQTLVPTGAEQLFDLRVAAGPAGSKLVLRIAQVGEPSTPWAGYWRDVLVR